MVGIDAVFDNPLGLIQEVILPQLTEQTGQSVFALIIGFAVLTMLYYASGGRWSVPAVVLTLSGAWLSASVPAQFGPLTQSLIIIGLVAGVFAVARRFFLRPTA